MKNSKKQSALQNKSGETLVESIISIVIFAILMVAVTTITSNSLRIAKSSADDSERLQETVNSANNDSLPQTGIRVLTFKNSFAGINASLDVYIAEKDGIIAFYPVTP